MGRRSRSVHDHGGLVGRSTALDERTQQPHSHRHWRSRPDPGPHDWGEDLAGGLASAATADWSHGAGTSWAWETAGETTEAAEETRQRNQRQWKRQRKRPKWWLGGPGWSLERGTRRDSHLRRRGEPNDKSHHHDATWRRRQPARPRQEHQILESSNLIGYLIRASIPLRRGLAFHPPSNNLPPPSFPRPPASLPPSTPKLSPTPSPWHSSV